MDLRCSSIIILILGFVDCCISYVLTSTKFNETVCPSTSKCTILSHVGNNSTLLSGSNITLLFLPGNHTLVSSLTIKNLSSFTMMSIKGLPRPVIDCEQFANFHLLSISYVKIDGLSLNGCFNNSISMIDEFIIKDSIMLGKRNASGGALLVTGSKILIFGNLFESFRRALHLSQSTGWIRSCTFMNNTEKGGALHIAKSNITIEYSIFSFHTCDIYKCSGVAMYFKDSRVLVANCSFNNNKNHGAIVVTRSKVRIIRSYFSDNIAQQGGAAITSEYGGMTVISDTQFRHNKINYKPTVSSEQSLYVTIAGGTVHCRSCKMEIKQSMFEYNEGVALLGYNRGDITIKSCQFLYYNGAAELGGGFHATLRTKIYISGTTTFDNNVAHSGAAFYAFLSDISITGQLVVVNNTTSLGTIGIVHSTVIIKANIVFSVNIGSFFVYSGVVKIIPDSVYEEVTFIKNYQIKKAGYENDSVGSDFLIEGGAITLFASRLDLQKNTTLSHNVANSGGGILAVTSTIEYNTTLMISANTVTDTGGGLYLYQSELSVFGIISLSNNRAKVYVVVVFMLSVHFLN